MNGRSTLKPVAPDRTCLACRAAGGALCAPLSSDDVRTIRGYKSAEIRVDAHQHLYQPDENPGALFGVLSGWVMLYEWMEDGSRQILDFALPGEFVSFQAISGQGLPHAAQTLTETTLCVFDLGDFRRLMGDHPELTSAMIWLSARCEARAHDHLCNISHRPARARLIHLCLELFYRFFMRLPRERGESLPTPLTQRILADVLGLSLEHLNRTLRELRDDRIFDFRNGDVIFLDPGACLGEGGLDPVAFLPLSQRNDVESKLSGTLR